MSTPAAFEPTRLAIETFLATITMPFPLEWEGGKAVAPGTDGASWGRWSIIQGNTEPAVIGPGHTRGTGIVYLQIFTPDEGGTRIANQAADTLAAALDRLQLTTPVVSGAYSQITFGTVGMQDAGREKGFSQKNLACIFRRDTYS